jgi:hypothetical protein
MNIAIVPDLNTPNRGRGNDTPPLIPGISEFSGSGNRSENFGQDLLKRAQCLIAESHPDHFAASPPQWS